MNAHKLRTAINTGIVVTFIGLLITFPFKDFILGGLLFAMFSAALIGGLADSFAVKAIFGQPLRIKWPTWLGTNIVVRHRERLVNELVEMVQYELLSPASIRLALKDKKLSLILQNYLLSDAGEQTVKDLLTGAIKELMKEKNLFWLVISFKRVLLQVSENSKSSAHLSVILTYIFKEGIDNTAASFVVRMIKPLLDNIELRSFVQQIVQAAISKYEKDNRRRQVANQIANIDANQLTNKLFNYVDQWLYDFTDEQHLLRQKIKDKALDVINKINSDELYAIEMDKKINSLINSLSGSLTKGDALKQFVEKLERQIAEDNDTHTAVQWSQALTTKAQQYIVHQSYEKYDDMLLNWVLKFIENKQHMIGNLVQEKMNNYTTEQLIELIEDKAGRDLQFIRLNGAVVGGLIGGILFVAQLIIGGATI